VNRNPLLLIPGLLCNESLWREQIDGLRDCVEPRVADVARQESIRAMAQAVLDSAPQRFCLAGFSLGSQVALEIMATARERVERLALLSATSGGLLPSVRAALENAISMIQEGDFESYVEQSYSTYVHPSRVNDPALKRAFTDMARAVGPQAGIRQMEALLSIAGPFTGLNQIDCPTVVIGGRQDHRTTLAAHEELARNIHNSVLIIIEESGHFTPIEQPSSVTDAMRNWLT
jgi:pimeloyl-ACP methyl ester carboxylesterase